MDVTGPAGELVGQVEPCDVGADDVVGRDGFRCRVTAGGSVQQGVVRQLPVAGGRAVGAADPAVLDREVFLRHGEFVGGDRDVQVPDFGAHLPKRGTGMLDGQATRGVALIGAEMSCRRGHPDAGHVDIQLLGGDLSERREHALAQLDLAGTDFDDTVSPLYAVTDDPQPVTEAGIGRERRRQSSHGHEAAVRISAAAFNTARTTRLCAPQRHRLPSSAVRTSDSDGSGFVASRLAALTTIPDMQ